MEMPKIATKTSQAQAVSWRAMLPIHPAAELFPLIGKDELRELADDIAKHGLRERIELYQDETGSGGPPIFRGR
jgi:hypothetical protein